VIQLLAEIFVEIFIKSIWVVGVAYCIAMLSYMLVDLWQKLVMLTEELHIFLDFYTVFWNSFKIIFACCIEFYKRVVFLVEYFELHKWASQDR